MILTTVWPCWSGGRNTAAVRTWTRPIGLHSLAMILTTARPGLTRLDNRWTQHHSGLDMDTATGTSLTNDSDHGPACWSGGRKHSSGQDMDTATRTHSPMRLTTARPGLDNRWTQHNSGQDMDTATGTPFTHQ